MTPELRRKPDDDFVVRLVAVNLRPWVVPLRALTRIMDAVQRLVEQREEEEEIELKEDQPAEETLKESPPREADDRVLHLIDIASGSAVYKMALPNPAHALGIISETGEALKRPEQAGWNQATLSSISELSEVARSLGCQIEFRKPGKGRPFGDILATIGPSTYDEVKSSAFVEGHTSVYAKIERVGGATEMHCGIHVRGQVRMVICRIQTEDLVRDLGQYIYQHVMLSGRATWLRHNLHLKSLVITSFEPPKKGSYGDSLRKIRQASGGAWDDVADPDAYIMELRRT